MTTSTKKSGDDLTAPFRFLARILLFCFTLVLLLGVLYAGTRHLGPLSVYAYTIDRYRLLREITGPRIILVGGSSMIYGIDSQLLHDLSGRYPINLALNMGLGLPYILDEAASGTRAGDVVILAPEYDHFGRGCFSSFLCMRAISANPECIRFSRELLTPRNLFFACTSFPVLVQRYVMEDLFPAVPGRCRTNEYGDLRNELQTGQSDSYTNNASLSNFRRGYPHVQIEELNRFAAEQEEKGVRVFFFYPPYADNAFQRSGVFVMRLDSIFREELDVPMLNSPEDERYPDSLFYNTDYHLSSEGSRIRTERLWDLLSTRLQD